MSRMSSKPNRTKTDLSRESRLNVSCRCCARRGAPPLLSSHHRLILSSCQAPSRWNLFYQVVCDSCRSREGESRWCCRQSNWQLLSPSSLVSRTRSFPASAAYKPELRQRVRVIVRFHFKLKAKKMCSKWSICVSLMSPVGAFGGVRLPPKIQEYRHLSIGQSSQRRSYCWHDHHTGVFRMSMIF